MSYLDRRDATVSQLRDVLLRRVDKYATEETAPAARQHVEDLLGRLAASSVVDDARYARSFVESARLRGASGQKIRTKLAARGLDDTRIREALHDATAADGLDDLSAARAYVQKQRLLTRYDLRDPRQRARALASLGRQGFSYEIAQRALGLG